MDEITRAAEFAPLILVIDDDPQIRKVFGQLLKRAGYSFHEAINGLEAKALILRVHFNLIILDLAMPEMDGFELLLFARRELPDLKIIVASGFMKDVSLRVAKLFGAVATLDKPVESGLFLSTVRNVLAGQLTNKVTVL